MHCTKTISLSFRLTLLGLLSVLAACGGKSEQEKACDQAAAGYFPILNGIKCIFGSTDNGTAQQPDSGTAEFTADSPSPGDQVGEYEPNSSLDNANPLAMNDFAISVTGNVALANDAADNFVFTPKHTGDYRVFLCADSCDHALESDTLNLMVLDQSQSTIAATSLGPIDKKTLSLRLYAGVAYYTEVSTFGGQENYRLVIAKNGD